MRNEDDYDDRSGDTTATSATTAREKALALNLDATSYGTFAEIGGGQEVARWFFAVGGAAGTVAKTISAYDMAISDGLYGPAKRYVSRQRLEAMLTQEFDELRQRLDARFGAKRCFFAFADTVATRSFKQPAPGGRGWIGIRFQHERRAAEPSQIIVHAHLPDSTAAREQQALGILGVNLIHGAFFHRADPARLIAALMDGLSRERVEVDMIKFSGPAFAGVDNRLMTLQLVDRALTDAAMFTADGEVVQPAEVLYKRPILVERGSFRPATKLTLDLLERALERFLKEPAVRDCKQKPAVLAEMTLRNLNPQPMTSHDDFLARADILRTLGFDVLISRFEPYYQLADYLATYTEEMIGLAVGLPTLRQVADESYYYDLPGGVLESVGRLFKRAVKMYVYPTRDPQTGQIRTLSNTPPPPPWHHLRNLLVEIGRLEEISASDESYLSIRTPDVLARIAADDPSWEGMVPPAVAEIIRAKGLFRTVQS